MTLILSPQVESRLIQEARVNGLSPEAYAEQLLVRSLKDVPAQIPPNDEKEGLNRPTFGSARGMVTIPDDFDEPLEDFKECMY